MPERLGRGGMMGGYDVYAINASDVYTATVTSTKAEVTDDPNSLIFSIHISNGTAAIAYLQVFDLDADNVTVGTTAPTYALGVAAGATADLVFGKPIQHTTGFTVASTTTRTGSVSASQDVTILYRHNA